MFTAATLLEVAAWGHGQAFGPLFMATALGVPEADVPRWTGILAAAPLAVAVPLSPFWGVLADRYSRKAIILRCFLVAAVAYALAALAQDVWHFLGVRLLLGLTFGSNALVIATMTDLAPHRRLGLVIGVTQMMFPIGHAVGPLLGSGLIEWVGLRGMFAVDAVMAFIGFLLVLLLYQEPPRRADSGESLLRRVGAVGGVVWQEPVIRLIFVLFAVFAGGWALVTPFLPVLIARVYEGENVALAIGVIFAGYGALAGIAAPVAGRLADWLGPTRLVTFNMVGLAVMSAGLMFAASPLQVGLVMLLGAIPYGASNTVLYAHLARYTPPEHMGAIMSLSPMARNSGMLAAPLVGAAVAGFGLQAVFGTAAALYAFAVGLTLVLARVSRRAPAPALQPDSLEG